MNTHETYVSLEVAKLLKEAGFNWEVEFFYQDGILNSVLPDELFNGNFEDLEYYYKHIGIPHRSLNYNGGIGKFIEVYSAPTLDVAQRWLREVKGNNVDVISVQAGDTKKLFVEYDVVIKKNDTPIWPDLYESLKSGVYPIGSHAQTYEEALEAGIKKALTLILEKKV